MTYRTIILHPITDERNIEIREFKCKPEELNNVLHGILNGHYEIVRPFFMLRGYLMLVDDEGLLKDLPYNPIASRLYPGWVVGDAIIMKEGVVHGEPDIISLSKDEIELMMPMMRTIQEGWRAAFHD